MTNGTSSVQWVHGSVFRPFHRFFHRLGVPVERHLAAHRLPPRHWDDRQDVVPLQRVMAVTAAIAKAEGIPNAGQAVCDDLRSNGGSWLLGRPRDVTLYAALLATCSKTGGITSTDFRLEERVSSVVLHRRPNFIETERDYHGGWFGIAAMIEIARLYLGVDWVPPRVAVPRSLIGQPWLEEALPGTVFVATEDIWWLEFPRRTVSAARPEESITGEDDDGAAPVRPTTLSCILGRIVRSYLAQGPLTLAEAAEAVEVSPRSLQRWLAEERTSYRRVMEEQRYAVARRLLDETDASIAEIADAAGYVSASNFARAFRRITGMAPREYRGL